MIRDKFKRNLEIEELVLPKVELKMKLHFFFKLILMQFIRNRSWIQYKRESNLIFDFGFLMLLHNTLRGLYNAKATLVKEP